MKKIVLMLDLHDDRAKQKALKTVAALSGIDSIGMEMREKKLTVVGTADPITLVSKLRKQWPTTDLISVGPAKGPEKKEGECKNPEEGDDKKAGEVKKEKDDEKKDETEDKKEEKTDAPVQMDPVWEIVRSYQPNFTRYYYVQSIEENPNACIIC